MPDNRSNEPSEEIDSPFPFEILPSGEYGQLLMGAHRKPALPVGTPSLTWHIGLWKELDSTEVAASMKISESSDYVNTQKKARRHIVDEYIQTIFKNIRRLSPATSEVTVPEQTHFSSSGYAEQVSTHDDTYLLFDNVIDCVSLDLLPSHDLPLQQYNQAITLDFLWHHIRCRIMLALHTEYLSITSILDLSDPVEPEIFAAFCDSGSEHYDETASLFYRSFDSLHKLLLDGVRDQRKYDDIHFAFYFDVWKQFRRDVFVVNREIKSQLGAVFANFHGLIVGNAATPNETERNCIDVTRKILESKFGLPFPTPETIERRLNAAVVNDDKFNEDKLFEWWPFLVSGREVDSNKYEFTASTMLDKRVIYVSSLGAQPPYVKNERTFPLLYFIYSSSKNKHQLGRLVDRIHNLGTLRLAAIKYHRELVDAGSALRTIEKKIDQAVTLIESSVRKEPNPGDDPDDPNQEEERASRESLLDIRKKFSEIETGLSGIVDRKDGSPQLLKSSALEYRIERSRYYVKQFEEGINWLRIGRIEGYQPYNVFIQRRLGTLFQYIDRLGTRFAKAQVDKSALFNYYMTKQAINIELVSREEQKKIKSLQAMAELILLAVLCPYYTGLIIEHFIEHLVEKSIREDDIKFNYVMAAVWLCNLSFWWTAAWIRDEEKYKENVANFIDALTRRWRILYNRKIKAFFRKGYRHLRVPQHGTRYAMIVGGIVLFVIIMTRLMVRFGWR